MERYQEFVPFVKRSFVCKDARSSAGGGSVNRVYNVVKAPVVGPRDFVIKIDSRARGADGSMKCSWHVPDDGVGPPALSGHVRHLKNSGGWELREASAGGGVAVRYRALTDPGTALPGFLVDLANQSSVPDVMRAFNARATSGVYEREDAAAAAAAAAGSGSREPVGFSPGWSAAKTQPAASPRSSRSCSSRGTSGGSRRRCRRGCERWRRVGREGWRSEERKRRA